MLYRFVLIGVLMVCTQSAFNNCPPTLRYSDYTFDLSQISSAVLAAEAVESINLSPCTPFLCGTTLAFVCLKTNNTPYSIGSTIASSYSIYNKSSLQIDYLPYSTPTDTFHATLRIVCAPTTTTPTCSIDATTPNKTINCVYLSSAGCPTSTSSYFWEFLFRNRLWFALPLWGISFTLLITGYLILRITIFLYGVLTGAGFGVIFIALNYTDLPLGDSTAINVFVLLLSILLGVLLGATFLTLPKLGYVNIGFWVATIVALLFQNSLFYLTSSLLALYISLGVFALVMAVIALMAPPNFIIVSTSLISSFWVIRTLGLFLPYYPNELIIGTTSTPWQFYLYLISIVILTILGVVVQRQLTKKYRPATNHYYMESDKSFKAKCKELLEFKEIKELIAAGKQELLFLKDIIVEDETNPPARTQQRKLTIEANINSEQPNISSNRNSKDYKNNKNNRDNQSKKQIGRNDYLSNEEEIKNKKNSKSKIPQSIEMVNLQKNKNTKGIKKAVVENSVTNNNYSKKQIMKNKQLSSDESSEEQKPKVKKRN